MNCIEELKQFSFFMPPHLINLSAVFFQTCLCQCLSADFNTGLTYGLDKVQCSHSVTFWASSRIKFVLVPSSIKQPPAFKRPVLHDPKCSFKYQQQIDLYYLNSKLACIKQPFIFKLQFNSVHGLTAKDRFTCTLRRQCHQCPHSNLDPGRHPVG